jgi:hypothetical protein
LSSWRRAQRCSKHVEDHDVYYFWINKTVH